MAVRPGRAVVVGGSVAGLLSAGALRRSGWDVTVHERTAGALQDRGAGVILPVDVHERLVDEEWLGPDTGAVPITRREWLVADAAAGPLGRTCWEHPLYGRTNNWGVLWRSLLDRLPGLDVRRGEPVDDVRPGTRPGTGVGEPPQVDVGGVTDVPDLVVGADGYNSAVRAIVSPGDRPSFSGYVLWRGTYDADLAPTPALDLLERGVFASPVHPGGHAVIYLVPGHDPGTLRMNWALYGRLPADTGLDDPGALPHGALDDTFATELERVLDDVPPVWAELMRIAPPEGRLVQPIYDHTPSAYAAPGVLLAGDAAAVARPHTGSGVAKAAADAFALVEALHRQDDLPSALHAYDAARLPAGTALVEAGRRLGHGMVEQVPDWAAASSAGMRDWAARVADEARNYMFTVRTADTPPPTTT